MALIEIDGLPFLKMGGSFHGELLNNQSVWCGEKVTWDDVMLWWNDETWSCFAGMPTKMQ